MGLLSRLTRRRPDDPYWDAFVNRPHSDPAHDLTEAIRTAPGGRVFPAVHEIPAPEGMSRDLAQLALFLGAIKMGVAKTEPALLRPDGLPGQEEVDIDTLVATHPFIVIAVVRADYDPAVARGFGGQYPRQRSAAVNFNLMAYIRELGYHSRVCPVDSVRVAVAAGVGNVGKGGGLVVPGHGNRVYAGDGVLTDLPLVLGSPLFER